MKLFGDSWKDDDSTILVWDGKGSMDIVANAAHVHDINGTCIKRRYLERCDRATLPIPGAVSPQRSGLVNITPLYDEVCMVRSDPKTLQEEIETEFYQELEDARQVEITNTYAGTQYVDRYKNQSKPSTRPRPLTLVRDWEKTLPGTVKHMRRSEAVDELDDL